MKGKKWIKNYIQMVIDEVKDVPKETRESVPFRVKMTMKHKTFSEKFLNSPLKVVLEMAVDFCWRIGGEQLKEVPTSLHAQILFRSKVKWYCLEVWSYTLVISKSAQEYRLLPLLYVFLQMLDCS